MADLEATTGAVKSDRYTKLGADLQLMVETDQPAPIARLSPFRSRLLETDTAREYVTVDIVAKVGQVGALEVDLRALGMKDMASFGSVISGNIPVDALDEAALLDAMNFMRTAQEIVRVGSVSSQGDAAMGTDIVRAALDVDGSGQKIGILSDSFNRDGSAATNYADDIANGDLPNNVQILDDSVSDGSDEGRAMAQLIHDVAPGSDLVFHTAFKGQANFARGIVELAEAGATVIVDDVGYRTEPFFQDGIIAQAVDQVFADGVAYVSAAGNMARDSHEQAYVDSGINRFGVQNLHDFGGGDIAQTLRVAAGETATITFQWDEPFASAGGPGSASDIDFVVRDANDAIMNNLTQTSLGRAVGGVDFNIDADPVELVEITNTTNSAQNYRVSIGVFEGPTPSYFKYHFENVLSVEKLAAGGTSFGHPSAEGGLGIGAADFRDTPIFGDNSPDIEPFSSAGGAAGQSSTPIFFDDDGNRLANPEIRERVDLVGPDGASTSFFGQSDRNGDTFPDFFGTSAAAPHVAASIALMLEADPALTAQSAYNRLRATAIDMDDPTTSGFDNGYDNLTGHGLIDAVAATRAPTLADDFRQDPTTSGAVAVNGSALGTIETQGDRDWFGVDLTLGRSYQFDVTGSGSSPLADPKVALFSAQGSYLTANNDGGPGLDPRMSFSANANGRFYVQVADQDERASGQYRLSVDDVTPANNDGVALSGIPYTPQTTLPSLILTGTNGRDLLVGSRGADLINALAGNDNPINGNGGNDVFVVSDGFDKHYGGSGNDTAIFASDIANYSGLDFSGNNIHVVVGLDRSVDDGNRNRIVSVENFEFADALMNAVTGEVTFKNGTSPPPPTPTPDPDPDPDPNPPGDFEIAGIPYVPQSAIPTVTLDGTSRSERLEGTNQAELIDAGSGDDQPIRGFGGDDVFVIGDGFDKHYGDGGDDTALFAGNIGDYSGLVMDGSFIHVVQAKTAAAGDGEKNRLVAVETFEFADALFDAFSGDVTFKSGAGSAFAALSEPDDLSDLLAASDDVLTSAGDFADAVINTDQVALTRLDDLVLSEILTS